MSYKMGDQEGAINGASTKWQLHPLLANQLDLGRLGEKNATPLPPPSFWFGQTGQCWPICQDGDYWFWEASLG